MLINLTKGNWFIIPGKNINICYMHELTKWWGVRPKPCLCAPDDWLSDEYVSLMAAVLHCISHQVMSVVHHFAIEWWQGRGARNCFAFWHIAGPLAIWTALDCFRTN